MMKHLILLEIYMFYAIQFEGLWKYVLSKTTLSLVLNPGIYMWGPVANIGF